MINWHRLFGLFLTDFFTDSPFDVELEKDLSSKRQFLDVVIIRRNHDIPFSSVPDGLEDLADHNLLSYKSLGEPFDDWAVKELTGHYVNYRKQVSPALNRLLPEQDFRLFGVSTRFPEKLHREVALRCLKAGVYELCRGTDSIRIIVLSEIAEGEHNAIWRLFSYDREVVLQAKQQYQVRQREMSTIVQQLFENYQREKFNMAYTVEDFQKDYVREHLDLLSADDRLQGLSPDDRLKGLSPDDRLHGLSPDDRLDGLSPDDRLQGLTPDDIVNHLSRADLEKLMEKLEKNFISRK
ncbi:MAG: calcium-binding protein [Methylococcales bacterium]